jgi:hypothetical protein
MPSTYSSDLKLELMVTGENANTWGDKTNNNWNLIQQAVTGYQSITLTSSNTTLVMTNATISNARNAVLKFTGTITTNCTIYVATGIEKTYLLENNTSGNFTVALNQVGGSSVVFDGTDKSSKIVYLNGTDAVNLGIVNLQGSQTLTNKTLTSPTINNGTANTIVLTSPRINTITDTNANSEIILTATASAVNQITVANAASGNSPSIAASGSDSNINLSLIPKGLGQVTFSGTGKIQQVLEKITVTNTVTTGTVNYDLLSQAILYHTGDASGQFTVNFRGDGSNTLNAMLAVGESATAAFLNTNSTTAYYTTFVTIDGTSTNVVTKWQGGSVPSSGNSLSIDAYAFTIIKTAASTYTVLAAQSQFK